jgi:hypothetical protein
MAHGRKAEGREDDGQDVAGGEGEREDEEGRQNRVPPKP